ncbi:hypothetical protein RJT34_03248 [Clitoria ternatea]|uniref:Transmembrane protein n=1 Tax=Clitoria ternatea TaxID=43366 RepID=A0AAN9PZN2_CLITE
MRLSIPALFLCLIFTFNVIFVFHEEAFISKGVMASRSSATVVNGCEKHRGECKEASGGSEESVFENEDYVYTNSLP